MVKLDTIIKSSFSTTKVLNLRKQHESEYKYYIIKRESVSQVRHDREIELFAERGDTTTKVLNLGTIRGKRHECKDRNTT